MWVCPRCERSFGRANRPHVCAPGMPVEFWLDAQPDAQRRAAEAVLVEVRRHAGVVVEAVTVGLMVKRERTIIEMRPKTRWLDLSFVTTATITSKRIARAIALGAATVYFVRLHDERDVDDQLRRWLAAALGAAPTARAGAARRPRRSRARGS